MARRKSTVRAAAKSVKKVVRRASRPAAGMSREDVAFLHDRIEAEERCEQLWSEMTAPAEEQDGWSGVEEHLLSKTSSREDQQRRWKFFGK
ncbi:MAG: hypothetical protein KGL53_06660 [Elusimicrobia bacterium]|nr:hypothetical protein [Elusimicrobiota bacterium]